MPKIILIAISLFAILPAYTQVSVSQTANGRNSFEVVATNGSPASIYYDSNDALVVHKVASLLGQDIERVTGSYPPVSPLTEKMASNSIIIGTLGQNKWIDRLVEENKLDVSLLKGKWESYLIQLVENPSSDIKKALVIVGSDRRGTAYGAFKISETIGVSPWYWWADAPVRKSNAITLKVNKTVSREPSVKYRGLFINDEDWGLLRWAKHTFEKERGNIGPRTYAKVCELLLRLHANYLCPAMHEASTAFNQIAENKLVADSFAIVMGSVHCEPLLFNNASEWDKKTMGEWDYINNKEGINRVLRKRVAENSPYENVYTLALRGLHDKAMSGSPDMKERVAMLESALNDQRRILVDVTGRPAEEIPQAFTPYKEVLDVYSHGLRLPDDVTIIWPDDNYGYMKRLSSPKEQQRSGRAGVYYHVSYLGKPHDYLWIASTPPALMFEELRKAYDTTADRIWLLNVGDIKSCEFPLDLFLNMAYDIDRFSYENIATYQAHWLSGIFGGQYYDRFLDVTNTYYNLAFSRKPELMGWGYQWSTNKHGRERNTDTDYSFSNYREAETRIAEYDRIGKTVTAIMNEMDADQQASFYQLLYYPVKGSEFVNKMVLYGQKNRWYAQQERAATNDLKKEAELCYDSLQVITAGYNSVRDGKWNHIMTTRQGFASAYFELPKLDSLLLPKAASMDIRAEGEDVLKGLKSFHSLPSFSRYYKQSYYIDIYNKGQEALSWKIKPAEDWIRVDRKTGITTTEDRIWISIDWNKVPAGDQVSGAVEIVSGKNKKNVLVSVFNPEQPTLNEVNGLFVEDNGYVSIGATDFHRKYENKDIQMMIVDNLGFEGKSVQMGNPVAPMQRPGNSTVVPRLEYDFYTFHHGSVDVYTYTLPTFPISSDREYAGHESSNTETKYGVCIDDGPVMTPTTSSFEYAQAWYENVLKNCSIKKTTLHIDAPGKHTVKILCGDPGVVVQKIVIDFGGLKRSYMGPKPLKVLTN